MGKLIRSEERILKLNHAVDIQTLLSASLTNQRTCLRGLQQANVNTNQFTFAVEISGSSQWVRNSVALINKLWIPEKPAVRHRRLLFDGDDFPSGFPLWLSGGDRRLLLDRHGVSANVTVVQDGSGNYKSIGDAINGAPDNSRKKYVICVAKGIYREIVEVPKNKRNIMLVGDGIDATVITGDRSVGDGWTMIDTATLRKLLHLQYFLHRM
ncbi:hypothetical protein KI387_040940, partial [Taxus chinensis]